MTWFHRSELVVLYWSNKAIQERQRSTAGALSPRSTFAGAAELYLAKVARKREDTTLVEYRGPAGRPELPAAALPPPRR
ncbi:hypothetical protein [Actinomycetospora sp. NBC_00405]|uniref:hypothetical protein n=1 Tax=Actinomycetospora sp. NBC_00405 TaxID=2975952 RepID=UPI002E2396DD